MVAGVGQASLRTRHARSKLLRVTRWRPNLLLRNYGSRPPPNNEKRPSKS